jgi:hypothetical protein
MVGYDSSAKVLACWICNSSQQRPWWQSSIGKERKSQKLRETRRIHDRLLFLQSTIFIRNKELAGIFPIRKEYLFSYLNIHVKYLGISLTYIISQCSRKAGSILVFNSMIWIQYLCLISLLKVLLTLFSSQEGSEHWGDSQMRPF